MHFNPKTSQFYGKRERSKIQPSKLKTKK